MQPYTGPAHQKMHREGKTRIAEFAVLAERCRAGLLDLAARVLESSEDADDVVQDALLAAFVSLSEIPAESQTAGWLCEIVLETAFRANRISAEGILESIEALSLDENNQRSLKLLHGGTDAERQYELQEMQALVSSLLESMNDARGRVFKMCQLEGCRKRQVAAVLNLSPSNVKALTFRTRRALRKEVSKLSNRRRASAILSAESTHLQCGVDPTVKRPCDHHQWSMGFVEGRLARGRRFQVLTLIDQHTRECLTLYAATALSEEKVAAALDKVIVNRGVPKSITVHSGNEFASKAVDHWSHLNRIYPALLRPGGPVANGYIETLNRSLRDECLNMDVFFSVEEVRRELELWRRNYNLHLGP